MILILSFMLWVLKKIFVFNVHESWYFINFAENHDYISERKQKSEIKFRLKKINKKYHKTKYWL